MSATSSSPAVIARHASKSKDDKFVETRAITSSDVQDREQEQSSINSEDDLGPLDGDAIKRLRRKVDLRLITIGGILASLDLLDSGIISSAAVTSMPTDLDFALATTNRYSIAIMVFTLTSVIFELPATVAVRFFGPRLWFSTITVAFGLITLCTAFITTWKTMVLLRILLGIAAAGIYPGLAYLISTWYPRHEQQLRFAGLQVGQVLILATGGIVNYALSRLDGTHGLAGWRYMFLVQGAICIVIGIATYWWMVDFPESSAQSFHFLTLSESALAVRRIQLDRGDVVAPPFTWGRLLIHARDAKVWGFAVMFFLLNLVSTALQYFLPQILQVGMGFSQDASILLSAPPYYYAALPVLLTSAVSDRYRLRGPMIVFNSVCLIIGMALLGYAGPVTARYVGVYLATGAYVSNWAALNAYFQNNIVGQWKRVFTAALTTAFNGAGGIAGAYIFRRKEAPRYQTAVAVCIASHVALIALVGLFSAVFWRANKMQRKGEKLIEGTIGFRHTY